MKQFETFRPLNDFTISTVQQKDPFCWNGIVGVRRYLVTVEEIVDSKEVIEARLMKLWEECDNHHDWYPLDATAKSFGIELPRERCGIKRKVRK